MAAASLIMQLLSMLGSLGGQQGGSSGSGLAGMLGRDTSDRGSFLNTVDPGGGFVDKKMMKARGISTKDAVLSNLTGGLMGSKGEDAPEPTMEELMDRMKAWERSQPEYIAYTDQLDLMNPENGYGAIQPDWGDLLERTIKKTQQVYRGSPTTTGVMDKIRADVAARNMGDSPALGRQMLKLGAQEAQDVGDVTTRMAEQERSMVEGARNDWINRLQSLAGYGTTPPNLSQLFQLDALQQPQQSQGSSASGLGSMLSGLFSGNSTKQAVPTSVTSGGSVNYPVAGGVVPYKDLYSPLSTGKQQNYFDNDYLRN